jgi:uncharacterized protein (DUF952 family)
MAGDAMSSWLMTEPVLHITTNAAWQAALTAGVAYRAPSLETEGFIHCSTPAQVPWVANRRFRGMTEPRILLRLELDALSSELKWETSEPDMPPFPHIYGPIDLAAVVEVIAYPEGPDGYSTPVLSA